MKLTVHQQLMILDWTRKIHTLEYAHRFASVESERLNLWLGIPAVVISGLIGAQVSTPWQSTQIAQTLVAIGASLVAILVGLQTFFKPTELAEKHRSSSSTYEDLRHRLELLYTFETGESSDVLEKLNKLKAEWDRLETPNVSKSAWSNAKKQVTSLGTYPESLQLPQIAQEKA